MRYRSHHLADTMMIQIVGSQDPMIVSRRGTEEVLENRVRGERGLSEVSLMSRGRAVAEHFHYYELTEFS